MNMRNPIYVALLGTTLFALPAAILAQADPMAPGMAAPATQSQPSLPQQQTGAATSMQDSSSGLGATAQAMRDKMFLRKASEGGMAEVQLGQLAADKASAEEVKAFGQKMVTDHTALNEQMRPIAESMGVRAPKKLSKEDQAEYDKLSNLTGPEFDIEYLTYMVKDHHKDLHAFHDETQTATDPALKEAVEKAQKVIFQHTMMVDKLAKDKGIPVPTRKPGPYSPDSSQ